MTESMKKSITLLLIDPQNDFHPGGSLPIPRANDDSERVADFITRHKDDIDEIFVSFDSHHKMHIAHRMFWVGPDGSKHPEPYSVITCQDVSTGVWVPRNKDLLEHAIEYTRQLESLYNDHDKYRLTIWPEHCLIGSSGHNIVPCIFHATQEWVAHRPDKIVHFHMKGMNNLTEMYSILKAEIPLDKATEINIGLVQELSQTDLLVVAGQALSHCVKHSVRDLLNHWNKAPADMVLLEDGSSPVPGFEEMSQEFVKDLISRGVQVMKIEEFSQKIQSWK